MADYYNPSVVEPPIPMADMTACERLLLTGVFEHDIDEAAETVRFYCSTSANDMPAFEMADLLKALTSDVGIDNLAARLFLEHIYEAGTTAEELILDLSTTSHESVFQDIVRRSPDLRYVEVRTSFMCSKMAPDGFGGMSVLITASDILSRTTEDILKDLRLATGLEAPPDDTHL